MICALIISYCFILIHSCKMIILDNLVKMEITDINIFSWLRTNILIVIALIPFLHTASDSSLQWLWLSYNSEEINVTQNPCLQVSFKLWSHKNYWTSNAHFKMVWLVYNRSLWRVKWIQFLKRRLVFLRHFLYEF